MRTIIYLLLIFILQSCKGDKEIEISKSYYTNGRLREKKSLKNGQLHGKSISYFENGNIKSICNYSKGLSDGLCICYFENGNLKWADFHKDGKKHGFHFKYYETGTLRELYMYNNDTILLNAYFYPDYNIHFILLYHENKENGPGLVFDTYGVIKKIAYYRNDSVLKIYELALTHDSSYWRPYSPGTYYSPP